MADVPKGPTGSFAKPGWQGEHDVLPKGYAPGQRESDRVETRAPQTREEVLDAEIARPSVARHADFDAAKRYAEGRLNPGDHGELLPGPRGVPDIPTPTDRPPLTSQRFFQDGSDTKVKSKSDRLSEINAKATSPGTAMPGLDTGGVGAARARYAGYTPGTSDVTPELGRPSVRPGDPGSVPPGQGQGRFSGPKTTDPAPSGLILPFERGKILSVYGDPRDNGRRSHKGIDLAGEHGTPVWATSNQRVTEAGVQPMYGRYVKTIDERGNTHVYAHLDTITAKRGDELKQGQQLGTLGKTGNAATTPPHVHYEIRPPGAGYNQAIDPRPYLFHRGQNAWDYGGGRAPQPGREAALDLRAAPPAIAEGPLSRDAAQPGPTIRDVDALTTFYAPGAGGMRSVEGPWATSKPNLEGQYIPRTLDDVRLGRSKYVTLASDPRNYGKYMHMGDVTYTSPLDGKTYTLKNVTGYVHDTGSAFRGRPHKYDVAVGNFSRWRHADASRFVDRQPYGMNRWHRWREVRGIVPARPVQGWQGEHDTQAPQRARQRTDWQGEHDSPAEQQEKPATPPPASQPAPTPNRPPTERGDQIIRPAPVPTVPMPTPTPLISPDQRDRPIPASHKEPAYRGVISKEARLAAINDFIATMPDAEFEQEDDVLREVIQDLVDEVIELRRESAELHRRMGNVIRPARVTQLDPKKGVVKLTFATDDDGEDVETGWIRWGAPMGDIKLWSPPKPDSSKGAKDGEQVILLSPGGEIGMLSWAQPGGFTEKNKANHNKAKEWKLNIGKNTEIHLTEDGINIKTKKFKLEADSIHNKAGKIKDEGGRIDHDKKNSPNDPATPDGILDKADEPATPGTDNTDVPTS